jgi:hypothetical protein
VSLATQLSLDLVSSWCLCLDVVSDASDFFYLDLVSKAIWAFVCLDLVSESRPRNIALGGAFLLL